MSYPVLELQRAGLHRHCADSWRRTLRSQWTVGEVLSVQGITSTSTSDLYEPAPSQQQEEETTAWSTLVTTLRAMESLTALEYDTEALKLLLRAWRSDARLHTPDFRTVILHH
eukprot:982432-Rhodomonas_salina.3